MFVCHRQLLKCVPNGTAFGLRFYCNQRTGDGTNTSSGWDYNWDGRDKCGQTEHSAQRHLILVRHGQCNLSDPKQILTELGRHQASLTGKRICELNWPITELITSKLSRAQETGQIISTFLPKTIARREDDALNEGHPIKPIPNDYWRIDCDTVADDRTRIDSAFETYFYRPDATQETDSYTLIVSHANVMRYLVCRALQFDSIGWLRFTLYNGSITWLSINTSGVVRLRCLGDAGYMVPNALSVMNFTE